MTLAEQTKAKAAMELCEHGPPFTLCVWCLTKALQSARREALTEAARLCDARQDYFQALAARDAGGREVNEQRGYEAGGLAAAIRSLASKEKP